MNAVVRGAPGSGGLGSTVQAGGGLNGLLQMFGLGGDSAGKIRRTDNTAADVNAAATATAGQVKIAPTVAVTASSTHAAHYTASAEL